MLGFGDLVLCAGTVVDARFEQHLEAAVAGGFAGVSVYPWRVRDAVDRHGSVDVLRRMVDDLGLEIADLDAILDWVDLPKIAVPNVVPDQHQISKEEVLELAAGLGARSVNLCDISQFPLQPEQLIEPFAKVCDGAASYGLQASIEFVNISCIDTLERAAALVAGAGRPNGGVTLDTWHYNRGRSAPDHQVDRFADEVLMLQVSDAPPYTGRDWWDETMNGRLLPGGRRLRPPWFATGCP